MHARVSRLRYQASVAILLVALSLVVGAQGANASLQGHTQPSIKSVIANSKAAMLRQKSVHYEITVEDLSTKETYEVVANLGKNSGTEDFKDGSAVAHVRLTAKNGYFSGNASGLVAFFGMPQADTTKVATKWVLVGKGSAQFKTLQANCLLANVVKGLFPAVKGTTLTAGTVHGTAVNSLHWKITQNKVTSTEKLDIAAHGTPLPIDGNGSTSTVTQAVAFSKWNKNFAVLVPSATIPFSKVS